jgi:membrane protein
MAAALAYYTFIALTPLLILAVLIAGILFGEAAVRGEIVERTKDTIGRRGGEAVQGILESAGRPGDGIVALVVGLVALLFGAARAFQELQEGLNRILAGPGEKKGGRKGILRRLIPFGLVFSVGLGLVMLMIGGMAFAAAGRAMGLYSGLYFARMLDYLITFGLGAVFLSLLYRFVPDKRPTWKDVWVGAGISAGLFVPGSFLVSLYIEQTMTASSYGAAGLLVVLPMWLYFSTHIVYVGAEVTRLRADSKAAEAT